MILRDAEEKPRAKMTDYARTLIVAELTRFHACGINITEVLNKSTKNNWTDVYAPKENGNGKANPTGPRQRQGRFVRAEE